MNHTQAKELLPIIQAFAEGKTIQVKNIKSNIWLDLDEPSFNIKAESYRIKPEPEKELNNYCIGCKGKGCDCGSCANKDKENSYYLLHKDKFPEHILENDKYERIGQHRIDKQNLKEYRTRFYRPFKDCDELIEYWINKWGDDCCISFIKPLIWVKNNNDNTKCLITTFRDDFVKVGVKTKPINMDMLYKDYEFLNGSPCGMEIGI